MFYHTTKRKYRCIVRRLDYEKANALRNVSQAYYAPGKKATRSALLTAVAGSFEFTQLLAEWYAVIWGVTILYSFGSMHSGILYLIRLTAVSWSECWLFFFFPPLFLPFPASPPCFVFATGRSLRTTPECNSNALLNKDHSRAWYWLMLLLSNFTCTERILQCAKPSIFPEAKKTSKASNAIHQDLLIKYSRICGAATGVQSAVAG